ncbi:hypothetical protein DFH09DRAFT_1068980 [Mycena vulgaris]|nr:hypothetical protein DFH09DRAFT_1068980 [Mycena vulgaris]
MLGGIESKRDDGDEKDWATGDKAKPAHVTIHLDLQPCFDLFGSHPDQVTSFAGIVKTNGPGLVLLRCANAGGSAHLKKAQLTLAHIPSEISKQFWTNFTPTLLHNVTIIWNCVFLTHPIVLNDPTDKLLLVIILKLLGQQVVAPGFIYLDVSLSRPQDGVQNRRDPPSSCGDMRMWD